MEGVEVVEVVEVVEGIWESISKKGKIIFVVHTLHYFHSPVSHPHFTLASSCSIL